ncbi:PIGT1 [Auxenochlorella protothecoides x Auxenochlorella symbiontica]
MPRPVPAARALAWTILVCFGAQHVKAEYHERMRISNTPHGISLLQAHFTMTGNVSSPVLGDLPAALVTLVRTHDLRRLEVSLTQGRRLETAATDMPVSPHGLVVKWVRGDGGLVDREETTVKSDRHSAGDDALRRGLGAILCAGMLHGQVASARPRLGWWSVPGMPTVQAANGSQQTLLMAPLEAACGENLARWQALLPCGVRAGLAAALAPVARVTGAATWRSYVLALQSDGAGGAVMELVLHLVGPEAGLQALAETRTRACPAATSSPALGPGVRGPPQLAPNFVTTAARVEAWSFVTHPSPTSGRLAATVRAVGGALGPGRLHVVQLVPRALRVVDAQTTLLDPRPGLHTLWERHETDEVSGDALLEVEVEVPAGMAASTHGTATPLLRLDCWFDRFILPVGDYPADASRGIALPGAIVTWTPHVDGAPCADSICSAAAHQVSAGHALVALPIPDFSMPFNVASFTALALSLIFASVLSVLLRDDAAGSPATDPVGQGVAKVLARKLALALLLAGVLIAAFDPGALEGALRGWTWA